MMSRMSARSNANSMQHMCVLFEIVSYRLVGSKLCFFFGRLLAARTQKRICTQRLEYMYKTILIISIQRMVP